MDLENLMKTYIIKTKEEMTRVVKACEYLSKVNPNKYRHSFGEYGSIKRQEWDYIYIDMKSWTNDEKYLYQPENPCSVKS